MNKKKAFVCDYKCSPFVAMLQNKQLTHIDIIIVAYQRKQVNFFVFKNQIKWLNLAILALVLTINFRTSVKIKKYKEGE